ncbi:U3 snoRNP protein [Cryptotrichosporon argae]
MEKVQFQLEATLPELKDLYDKGLFSKHEIDQITKRRTAYETSLIRGQTRKDDFFKYAEYEINLERLRKIRWKKLKYHVNPPPPSASTYSLPRRALYILKRATAKFPGDVAVWLAYVEFAANQGMTKVVAKGLNSALQHHALSPTIYLLLSYHHLHPGAPLPRAADAASASASSAASSSSGESFALEGTGPARTTLLLGLRVLPASHELWTEYIKLELGWVEALRRRWAVLGIAGGTGANGGEGADEGNGRGQGQGTADELVGEGSFGPEGEDARRQILRGELVVHALGGALEKVGDGTDGVAFRQQLLRVFHVYPSPLRARALDVVYDDLERLAAGPGRPAAMARLELLTRKLYDRPYDPQVKDEGGVVLEGLEYVDEIGRIAREIRKTKGDEAWGEVVGDWLVERIMETGDRPELRELFVATLKAVVKSSGYPPRLCLAHLALAPTPALARSYAQRYPADAPLQLAYLRAARDDGSVPARELAAICESAVRGVTRDHLPEPARREVEAVWLAWAECAATAGADADAWKPVLRASMTTGAAIPSVHALLLARFFAAELARGQAVAAALRSVTATYRPTSRFFADAFDALDAEARAEGAGATDKDAAAFYTAWRGVTKDAADKVDAALRYARWLCARRKGYEAGKVVDVVRAEAGDERERLEVGWREIMDDTAAGDKDMGSENEEAEDADEDDSDESEGGDESEDEGGEEAESADDDGDLQMF